MIGFYDYTVILTYISLACSVFGITRALEGQYVPAIVCLAISGLLDMFDGKVARTKKNRTDDERLFGVQLDSLCDIVCFGILPSVLCYTVVGKGLLTIMVIIYYCLCSVIRLAYFNVLETNRQRTEGGTNKYYHGLPITSIAVIIPFISLFHGALDMRHFAFMFVAAMIVTGTLFVLDFRFPKPSNHKLGVIVSLTGCAVLTLLTVYIIRTSKGTGGFRRHSTPIEDTHTKGGSK